MRLLQTKPARRGEGPPRTRSAPNGLSSQLVRGMFHRNLTRKAIDAVQNEQLDTHSFAFHKGVRDVVEGKNCKD